MRFSPAIHPDLVAIAGALDDGLKPIAAIWREVGRHARGRRLLQPSYESTRRIVHAHRELRRLACVKTVRALALATESLWRTRHPIEILNDAITHDAAEARETEYRWRPRPRASA